MNQPTVLHTLYESSDFDLPRPSIPCTSPDFHYVVAERTDITTTLKAHGWVPPDRAKQEEARLTLNKMN